MDRPPLVTGTELETLPSFGLSAYINLECGAETAAVLQKIRDGQDPSNNDSGELIAQGSSASLGPTTRGNNAQIEVFIEDTSGHDHTDPIESATEPIGTTVDISHILDTKMMEIDEMLLEKPKLHVKMTTDYMRFRYMSEKVTKKKGSSSRPRHYDLDDQDKHCLAEVWVDNYIGTGKIVAYCVDGDGRLHPYNLFGERCFRGVYVNKCQFRHEKVAKLTKVSVTTPKAKEYRTNLRDQLSYLREIGLDDVKFCDSVDDKQIVYVMVKVILDNKSTLSEISTPLQNKKKGKEFRIEDIQPVSAPASGEVNCNIFKSRVMLHVTEDTAFPSKVGVKIRERDTNGKIIWEEELSGDQIQVVKQCVVKFVPPPYRNPNTREDVEVDICLFDKKTKIETHPFKFIYKGSDNCGLEIKAKKRKLDKELDSIVFMPDATVQGSRKILSALRIKPASSSPQNSDSSSSDHSGSSADNSLTYVQETQFQHYVSDNSADNLLQSNETEAVASGGEDQAVSLLELRTAAQCLPFSSYNGNVEQGQNVGQSIFSTSGPQTVQHISRQQSVGFNGGAAGTSQLSNFNISRATVVTSTTSVFTGSQQTATYRSTPATMPTVSVNSGVSISSFQQQTQTSQPTNTHGLQPVIISEADKMVLAQKGIQLPQLGDNQMLAIVDGQIYIVNDDTAGPSTNATSTLTSYNSPAPVIQNIGQQQVIIQHIAPQQPSSEIEPQVGQMPGTTIVMQRNLAPIHNWSQEPIQIETAYSVTQTLGSLQNNTGNSAPLSVPSAQTPAVQQQQQYHQQQLQQQRRAEQLLQQVAIAAGLDLNKPGVKHEILQQIIGLQGQQQTQSFSDTSHLFASGSDLNDDDIEIDGVENPTINERTPEMEQRTKKLRGSSNIERDKLMQQNVIGEILPTVYPGQIPTLVNEAINVNEGQINDLVPYQGNQSKIQINNTFHNGSFENSSSSEWEDDA